MASANYPLLALSIAFYVLHFWGAVCHFRLVGPARPGLVALTVIWAVAFAAQLAGLWPSRQLWAHAWIAFPIYGAALGLWAWAVATTRRGRLSLAFSRDLPEAIIDRGPYRYVRHPFYASYTLYWLAGSVATLAWWVVAPSLLAIALYVAAAWSEERKFAASRLADAYAAYRARTGMFLPSFRRG
jgi:protein-S-isoprenylcysteine O-methyltransferase Ste14